MSENTVGLQHPKTTALNQPELEWVFRPLSNTLYVVKLIDRGQWDRGYILKRAAELINLKCAALDYNQGQRSGSPPQVSIGKTIFLMGFEPRYVNDKLTCSHLLRVFKEAGGGKQRLGYMVVLDEEKNEAELYFFLSDDPQYISRLQKQYPLAGVKEY